MSRLRAWLTDRLCPRDRSLGYRQGYTDAMLSAAAMCEPHNPCHDRLREQFAEKARTFAS